MVKNGYKVIVDWIICKDLGNVVKVVVVGVGGGVDV